MNTERAAYKTCCSANGKASAGQKELATVRMKETDGVTRRTIIVAAD